MRSVQWRTLQELFSARSTLLTNLDAELEQYGLSGVQYGVLKHLADGTALTAVDLSRLLHYDTGSMTRMLDRLEEKARLPALAASEVKSKNSLLWER